MKEFVLNAGVDIDTFIVVFLRICTHVRLHRATCKVAGFNNQLERKSSDLLKEKSIQNPPGRRCASYQLGNTSSRTITEVKQC